MTQSKFWRFCLVVTGILYDIKIIRKCNRIQHKVQDKIKHREITVKAQHDIKHDIKQNALCNK
jgi:hypothetical protein